MSELSQDFETIISQIRGAVTNALYGEMYNGLMDELDKSARKNVYSYNAEPYFMMKRRYMIADGSNMSREVAGTTLIVENKTALQCGEAGEVNIVEEGAGWNQPGPRPFMEEGLQNYASGRASDDLVYALQGAGFDAHT